MTQALPQAEEAPARGAAGARPGGSAGPVSGFLACAALVVAAVGFACWYAGQHLVRSPAAGAGNDGTAALASVRPGLEALKREVASALPLLNQDGKGNGQRFVLVAGGENGFDELQITTTVDDPRAGNRTTTHVRYFVEASAPGATGALVRDLWDEERGAWRGEPQVLCEGICALRIRYMSDPRGSDWAARTSRRLFAITASDGYDSKDPSGRWTGINPYLEGNRLVIDSTDRENPDAGPIPSRLQFVLAVEDPRSGDRVACAPLDIAIPTSQ